MPIIEFIKTNNTYEIADKQSRDILNKKVVYITPQQFGAVGDGETDDYNAFVQMFEYIDSIVPIREFTGEVSCKDYTYINMLFSGSYAVSKPVNINNTYGVIINGLNLIALSNFVGNGLLVINNVNRNTKITNSSFNGALSSNVCLYIDDYTLTTEIVNVEITRFKLYGIFATGKGHELKCVNMKINQVEYGEYGNINALVSNGTGIYLDTERYDNNFTQLVINYCKDYVFQIKSTSNTIMNSHFYGGDFINDGDYNTVIDCYFDGSHFKTKGTFILNGNIFANGSQTTPFIYLTDTQQNAYKYESASISNNIFRSDSLTSTVIDKLGISSIPNFNMVGNSFYNVTPITKNGNQVNIINPWDVPRESSGNTENGYAIYGDIIYMWGTKMGNGELTFPKTVSIIFNIIITRLDGNTPNEVPFVNSISNSGCWFNAIGSSSQVKWLIIGRL